MIYHRYARQFVRYCLFDTNMSCIIICLYSKWRNILCMQLIFVHTPWDILWANCNSVLIYFYALSHAHIHISVRRNLGPQTSSVLPQASNLCLCWYCCERVITNLLSYYHMLTHMQQSWYNGTIPSCANKSSFCPKIAVKLTKVFFLVLNENS